MRIAVSYQGNERGQPLPNDIEFPLRPSANSGIDRLHSVEPLASLDAAGNRRCQPRRIDRMRRHADGTARVRVANCPPEGAQGRDVHDVSIGKVAQEVAGLVRHFDAGQKVETPGTVPVQIPGGARGIGAVVIRDGKQVEIRLILDVTEQCFDRLITITPRIVAGMGVEIRFTHRTQCALRWYVDKTVVLGAALKTTAITFVIPVLVGAMVSEPRPP